MITPLWSSMACSCWALLHVINDSCSYYLTRNCSVSIALVSLSTVHVCTRTFTVWWHESLWFLYKVSKAQAHPASVTHVSMCCYAYHKYKTGMEPGSARGIQSLTSSTARPWWPITLQVLKAQIGIGINLRCFLLKSNLARNPIKSTDSRTRIMIRLVNKGNDDKKPQ